MKTNNKRLLKSLILAASISLSASALAANSGVLDVSATVNDACDVSTSSNVISFSGAPGALATSNTIKFHVLCNGLLGYTLNLKGGDLAHVDPTNTYNVLVGNISALSDRGGVTGEIKNLSTNPQILATRLDISPSSGDDIDVYFKIAALPFAKDTYSNASDFIYTVSNN